MLIPNLHKALFVGCHVKRAAFSDETPLAIYPAVGIATLLIFN
jgi:hypothetical protein